MDGDIFNERGTLLAAGLPGVGIVLKGWHVKKITNTTDIGVFQSADINSYNAVYGTWGRGRLGEKKGVGGVRRAS